MLSGLRRTITRRVGRFYSVFEGGGPAWARWKSLIRGRRNEWTRKFRRALIAQTIGRFWPERVLSRFVEVQSLVASNSGAQHGVDGYQLLEASRPLEIDEARYAELLGLTPYAEHAPLSYRPSFVCRLHEAQWHAGQGLLCTRDDALLLDSDSIFFRLNCNPLYGSLKPNSKHDSIPLLKGCYSSIWGPWNRNVFHWLIEYLPRLQALQVAAPRPLTLLMPETATTYQRESLACCVPDGMEVRYVNNDGWMRTEEFVFPSYITLARFTALSRSGSDYMRERIFKALQLPPDNAKRNRIYISRRGAFNRRVLNEPELMSFLEERGFKCYFLEKLSFAEQVKLFHEAEVVVAPHGAGLSNVLFSGRIKVVELQNITPRLHYCFLSQSLGQDYESIIADERPGSANFMVPLDKLGAALADFR